MEDRKVSMPKPFVFTPEQCVKYDVFLRWAHSCGHYGVKVSAENFDKFLSSVHEDSSNGPA